MYRTAVRRLAAAKSSLFFSAPSQQPGMRAVRGLAVSRIRTVQPVGHPTIRVAGFEVTSPHSHTTKQNLESGDYVLAHSIYTLDEMEGLKTDVHFQPATFSDRAALGAINLVRGSFDLLSRYDPRPGHMSADAFLTRCIFLETVAGVPGMVASMVRHLESLRLMRRDGGWIHTLLAEAENERMHLLTFLELKKPGLLMRLGVLGAQGVFFNLFFLSYLLMPSVCHRFVGFLEEEAVRTYTHLLEELDAGHLPEFASRRAPEIAIKYWRLPQDAMLRDVLLAIRADEAIHRDANHVFASLNQGDANPFVPK